MNRALVLSALFAAASTMAIASPANAAGECPSLGLSPDCSVVITINANGSNTITLTGIGPYDGSEDSLVGVVNNGLTPLMSLFLSGPSIFGFDGDGAGLLAAGGPFGPTGYEGPNTSFTVVDANSGTVNFLGGGIPTGGTAWFSLEEDLSAAGVPITIGAVPEPTTWMTMLLGFGAIGGAVRFRRRSTKVPSIL
jgi:hypothetical protein